MKVENYSFKASNGKHARMATRVILDNGKVIEFTEKMSKREAINQAKERAAKELPFFFGVQTMKDVGLI